MIVILFGIMFFFLFFLIQALIDSVIFIKQVLKRLDNSDVLWLDKHLFFLTSINLIKLFCFDALFPFSAVIHSYCCNVHCCDFFGISP